MTDACSGVSNRPRVSYDGDLDDVQVDAERAAEARRNAYFADGGDEGGLCRNAASDASQYRPYTPDQPQLKDAQRTASKDAPVQSDPWGNAIVGAMAGGLVNAGKGIAWQLVKGVTVREARVAVEATTHAGPKAGRPRRAERPRRAGPRRSRWRAFRITCWRREPGDGMIDELVMAFFRSRRRFADAAPRTPAERATPYALAARYAEWASRRGFTATADDHGYRGVVLGRPVLVKPGLDGSAPSGVEAEILVDHDFAEPFLVTSRTRDRAPDLAVLFDEVDRLRSVGVFAGGVRVRLFALVAPEVVDAAVDRTLSLFEERRRNRAADVPYR